MRRIITIAPMFLLLALLGTACGVEGPECGPGTRAEGDTCVPEISECAPGTTLNAQGQCEPACGAGQSWDGAACVDLAECAAGTIKDDSGQCVPACGEGQTWDGTACVDVPQCGPGASLDEETGQCLPDEEACGDGTHWEDGACVPDVSCGPLTHLEGGQCVPDTLPEADVTETGDPNTAREFTLPAAGGAIHLGGTVDTPTDLNGDGYDDADWDTFIFTAEAGAYLRVSAGSDGATLPAFLVMSVASNEEGGALYARWAINPNGASVTRELYLPFAGEYVIQFSDYNHVLARAFGYGYIPVGGDDFTYLATVENLGAPAVEDVTALPFEAGGELTDNSLRFFSLKGLSANDAVEALSLGQPLGAGYSDVYTALTLFGPDHQPIRELTSGQMTADVLLRFAATAAGDHLLVQDFLLTLGPVVDFSLSLTARAPLECTGADACAGGALAEGEDSLLAWDVAAGEYLVIGVYLPEEAAESVRGTLYDESFGAISEPWIASQYGNAKYSYYAETDMRLYLRLWEDKALAVPEYTVDGRLFVTEALQSGQSYSDLPVFDPPENTVDPAGLCHHDGMTGELVLFTGFTTKSGTWVDPTEQVLATDLQLELGPAFDVTADDFPATRVTPTMALLQDGGHVLYRVQDTDEAADIAGGGYDLGFHALTPTDLGDTSAAISQAGEALTGGWALYAFSGTVGETVEIAITPSAGLQPELMVLVPGARLYEGGVSSWDPDATSPTLGLVAQGSAAAVGEAALATHEVMFDGPTLVLVRDAGAAGAGETFEIAITSL